MRFFKRNWLQLITIAVMFLLTPALNDLQSGWNDRLMRRHLLERVETPIKIVYFDEKDIETLGGWPLARNVYALIAEQLCRLGVKAVGFDIYWGPRPLPADENDLLLAAVLKRRQNIYGSFYFDNSAASDGNERNLPSLIWPHQISPDDLHSASELKAPAPEFLEMPGRFGFANLSVEIDGSVRDAHLLLGNGNAVYPSFANVLTHYSSPVALDSALEKIKINYRVTAKQLPLISVRDLFQVKDDSSLVAEFRDSVVLVGVISPQLGFTKPTPIDPAMPVVGIHAQIVDNLLSKSCLRPFPNSLWLFTLILLAFIPTFRKSEKLPVVTGTFFLLAVLLFIVSIALWKIHIIFPLYAGLAGMILFSLPRFFDRARRQQKTIAEEVAKRETLEKQFAEVVRASSHLQEENEKTRRQHQKEVERLRSELTLAFSPATESTRSEFPEIVCASESPMAAVLSELKRIAATDAPVLITGESGTGKELVAKAIHQKSGRADKPFVAVNCGALAENLLESELFGHEKGAFTGAHQAKVGFFEAANHGTIFLDEISATTSAFQAKLLRVLQEGQFFRVGSTQVRMVDARIIAASNRPPEELIEAGAFREDLYFRLNVLPVHLPALRERSGDIPLLLTHFLQNKNRKISTEAMSLLGTYSWPGNIRELQNIAARIQVLPENAVVDSAWVQKQLRLDVSPAISSDSLDEKILQFYRELEFRNDANTQIAKRLGHLHRSTVTEYLKGMTFLFFAETEFNLDKTIRQFNPKPHPHLDDRVKNRMLKYLRNLCEELDSRLSVEANPEKLEERLRKLPQRYHAARRKVAKAYLQGLWKP